MHLLQIKKKIFGKKSERGFVLILALMGIMILLAIGYFALTVSTSDMMIAARLVGERKAFSAAEAGVHAITSNYNSAASQNDILCDNAHRKQVDPNDPHAFYCVEGSQYLSNMSQSCTGAFSIEGGVSWHCKNFTSVVTGRDTQYHSRVSIAVGVKGKGAPDTPGYDFN